MFRMPHLTTNTVAIYCAPDSLVFCALHDLTNPTMTTQSAIKIQAPSLWIVDGILYNLTWAETTIGAYVSATASQSAGIILACPSTAFQERLCIVTGAVFTSEDQDDAQYGVQYQLLHYDAVHNRSVWYCARVMQTELLKYKMMMIACDLYALACVPSNLAFLLACRASNISIFSELIFNGSVQDCVTACRQAITFPGDGDAYTVGVLHGLGLIGRALYEQVE